MSDASHQPASRLDFAGAARRIEGLAPYRAAAEALACPLPALRAVAEVESLGAPFREDGRPPILFERHVFSRRTGRAHDGAHPAISARAPGGYAGGAAEYDRLAQAMALDRQAALESASWGKFQIMGFNHAACGFDDVEAFVAAMCAGEAEQLRAFVAFVKANRLDRPLRALDWAGFAAGYNGPAYARNRYDAKLAAAFARFAAEERAPSTPPPPRPDMPAAAQAPSQTPSQAPGIASIRALQAALNHLGAEAGPEDGRLGPLTRAAILRFQRQARLVPDGAASPALMQAVQAVYFTLGGPASRLAG